MLPVGEDRSATPDAKKRDEQAYERVHGCGRREVGNRTQRRAREERIESSGVGGGSSDTVERSATGKQNVTITICARSARGKINDLTLLAGTSAPSQAAIAHGKGARGSDVKVTSSFAQ